MHFCGHCIWDIIDPALAYGGSILAMAGFYLSQFFKRG